jgi:hypothetical protein
MSLFVFLLASSFGGCSVVASQPDPNFPGLAIGVTCGADGVTPRYKEQRERFPGERGPSRSPALAGVLERTRQRALACLPDAEQAYRIVRNLSLDPVEVVVEVSQHPNTFRAAIATYNRETGAVRQSTISVNEAQWLRIVSALSATEFWSEPANEMPRPNGRKHTDGGWFAVEGYVDGYYHVVLRPVTNTRWNSAVQTFFQELKVTVER